MIGSTRVNDEAMFENLENGGPLSELIVVFSGVTQEQAQLVR